ncbi:hypothetical protein [Natronococcus sp.]|nr:hypothetical protein [Natronococcus sp.]
MKRRTALGCLSAGLASTVAGCAAGFRSSDEDVRLGRIVLTNQT